MKHLTEEELVLHHFGEGEAATAVEAHLAVTLQRIQHQIAIAHRTAA